LSLLFPDDPGPDKSGALSLPRGISPAANPLRGIPQDEPKAITTAICFFGVKKRHPYPVELKAYAFVKFYYAMNERKGG